MAQLLKIEKMHYIFGKYPGQGAVCKNCRHYRWFSYRGRSYRKCRVYGDTRCGSSDWKASYEACGLYNKNWDGDKEIINIRIDRPPDEFDGQLTFSEVYR